MKRVDDFRLRLGKHELVPIMVGGMGVDISTAELALEAARLGGIGHISDAMVPTVSDRRFNTKYVKNKLKQYKFNVANTEKAVVQFDLGLLVEATALHVGRTMEAKRGDGLVFINCMEKLTMNAPRETLRARLKAALDGGIDGITLAAGLHLGSFGLMEDHPRFREAKLGIIVSSLRALQLFLKKSARTGRLPDYVVIEGPLAGGHLGFGMDWAKFDLAAIVVEIREWMKTEQLDIPLIPAGGIFTGSDAAAFLETGAAAVQVATRFTVADECGLPADVQQEYFRAGEDDIEVNTISPTGYPMRMLKNSPGIGDGIRPNCEAYGYLLDSQRQLSVHRGLQPRSGAPSRGQEGQGHGQDLPVHPHAQLRDLDLRPLYLPAEGHHAAQRGRQLSPAVGGTHFPRLPVQHRREDRAARLTPDREATSPARKAPRLRREIPR
jgi:nitronate monooxygenase